MSAMRSVGAIDVHAHVIAPQVAAVTLPHSVFMRPPAGVDLDDEARAQLAARADYVITTMSDMEARPAAMDAMGVAMQVLSASLVHQSTTFAEPQESLALEQRANDALAQMRARDPARYLALGNVPLHAPDLAAQELRRCMNELGFAGVNISTRAREMEIGDPRLAPFWAAAEECDALVYIHPAGNPDARFAKHFLWNSIGQSFEEAMAIASLMYEGVLVDHPALRICVSHGGGYMPYYMGRIERNYLEKPVTRRRMSGSPADFLRKLWYDSCVYDPRALRVLADVVGVDRIVLGTDYPVGDRNQRDFIASCGFSDAEKTAIWRGNAERMLRI